MLNESVFYVVLDTAAMVVCKMKHITMLYHHVKCINTHIRKKLVYRKGYTMYSKRVYCLH